MKELIDNHGRKITYLRLSVTDRCDFRCVYCMAEEMKFIPHRELMTLEEALRVVNIFSNYGVTKVRLTGGEPLIRRNVQWLFKAIRNETNIKQIALTTNGSQIPKLISDLKEAKINKVNISLDTLDPQSFREITRTGNLATVLQGVDAAISASIPRIRLNAVIVRGKNEDQIIPLVHYALSREIDIAFIEEMPMGEVSYHRTDSYFLTKDVIHVINQQYQLIDDSFLDGGPAKYFKVKGYEKTKIGFISPHSGNFCDQCNRVRLTVDGKLLLCLGQENSIDIRALLRSGKSDEEIAEAIQKGLQYKKAGHEFDIASEKPIIFRHMNDTGG